MARNKVIQVACPPDLYSKVQDYKGAKNLASDADAMRELTLFALRVIEHSSDEDEGISTRELLEVLLGNVGKEAARTGRAFY